MNIIVLQKSNIYILVKYDVHKKIIIFCIIFILFVLFDQYIGDINGRNAAVTKIGNDALNNKAPSGFMGSKWLMSMTEVKKIIPEAYLLTDNSLQVDTFAFHRPAFVDLFSFFKKRKEL